MSNASPNAIDYLTLAAAIISPIASAWVTIWSSRRNESEKIDLHIDWAFEPHGEAVEYPILHAHNKSAVDVLVTDIRLAKGMFWRKPTYGTALDWEDPLDLPFPAVIKAGQIRRFPVSEAHVLRHYNAKSRIAQISSLLRRSCIWLELRTAGRHVQYIGAEDAIAWTIRPEWRKISEEPNNV